MPDYHVTWEITLTADSFRDAAAQALDIQRDPGSVATWFRVALVGSESTELVDVEDDPCERRDQYTNDHSRFVCGDCGEELGQ